MRQSTIANVNSTDEPSDLIPTFPTDIDCYMPANGETATVTTNPSVPVDISLNLLKREMVLGGAFKVTGGGPSYTEWAVLHTPSGWFIIHWVGGPSLTLGGRSFINTGWAVLHSHRVGGPSSSKWVVLRVGRSFTCDNLIPVFQGLFLIPKSLAPCTEP